jgi:hypothetical protein
MFRIKHTLQKAKNRAQRYKLQPDGKWKKAQKISSAKCDSFVLSFYDDGSHSHYQLLYFQKDVDFAKAKDIRFYPSDGEQILSGFLSNWIEP